MQRIVAIKTALGEALANPEFERLFVDEARIASLIQHPNVCGIQGLDEENGVTYLVMDWSDGGTLRELLDALPGQKTDPYVAARIVADVCAGLHAAHELDGEDGSPLHVVHRDVSPQNVLIASSGHVRIADFGVAKARGQLHRPTETGEMKGKLSYMAPEQVTTRDLDRRVDIFALGCVLYEATLGVRPFHGEDALSTLYQLLEQELVRPSTLDPEYPQGLEQIVVKALAKSPDDRYPTAEAMQHDLRSWLAAEEHVVTERTVAALLRQAIGKKIEQRQTAIQAAIVRLDAGEDPSSPPPIQTDSDTVEPSIRSVDATVGASLRNPRLLWSSVAAAATAVAAGAVAIWFARPLHSVRAISVPIAALSVRLPEPPRVAWERGISAASNAKQIKVSVTATPSHATLRIDGGATLRTPYSAELEADNQPHTIELSAPGFKTDTQTVSFDRDRNLAVSLEPLPAASRTAASSRRPRSDEARIPDAEKPPGSDLVPSPRRAPRQLDEENPF